MLLRELIVALRMKIRKSDFTQAERSINRIKRLAGSLVGFFSARFAFMGFLNIVKDGSVVQETLNLMRETFKEFTPEVLAWSEEMGTTLGRSKFLLQGFASSLQAMLVPMTGSREEAARMSMTLSELAVDLASFFNTTEQEALTAIRAGLAGEVEPLRRRFGIVLTERAMADFSKTTVNAVRNMTEMERTQLRFRFIMARSTDAQGDAVRTAGDYANVVRAMKDKLDELRKTIGLELIPSMTQYAGMMREIFNSSIELIKGTTGVQSAFYALSIAAAVAGVAMLVAFAAPLGVALLITSALASIAFFFDEVNALMDDDVEGFFETLFNTLFTELGVTSGMDFVTAWIGAVTKHLATVFIPGAGIASDIFDYFSSDSFSTDANALSRAGAASATRASEGMFRKGGAGLGQAVRGGDVNVTFQGPVDREAVPFIMESIEGLGTVLSDTAAQKAAR